MRGISRPAVVFLAWAMATVITPASARPTMDPMQRGAYQVTRFQYDNGYTTVRDPRGVTFVERLQGSVHVPKGRGPFPLLVFLHGRHGTCEIAERFESLGFPCPDVPPATRDVPSYLGFGYLARHLASHGFVVVSISANGINSYDLALIASDNGMNMRAEIVARNLDLIAQWNEGGESAESDVLAGKIDFDRIGLMGHSRGGEGVARFVAYNRARSDGPTYKGLRAVFGLAPTDYHQQEVAGVHYGTLLPLCDGDVYDLHGAWTFDRARFLDPQRFARVQFTVNGTNHNFFNTVWTYDDGPGAGDDEDNNPACDPGSPGNVRLTAEEQRDVGLALMSSFFLRYVGGDERYEPYVTGAESLSPSACPRAPLRCEDVVGYSYLGPADSYRMLLRPTSTDRVANRGKVDTTICSSFENGTGCPTVPTRSIAEQLTVVWTGPGVIRLPVNGDVAHFAALTFRGGMNFKDPSNKTLVEQDFEFALVDERGREAVVRTAPLGNSFRRPEGPSHQQLTMNGTHIPLGLFTGVDLTHLDRVELRFGGPTRRGSIQLLEIAFQDY